MYLILAYDADPKSGQKIFKIVGKYLEWKQFSLFKGEISKLSFLKLKNDIKKLKSKIKDNNELYFVIDYSIIENRSSIDEKTDSLNYERDREDDTI